MKTLNYSNKKIDLYNKIIKNKSSDESYYTVKIIVNHVLEGNEQIYPFSCRIILEKGEKEKELFNTLEQIAKDSNITKADCYFYRNYYTEKNLKNFSLPDSVLFRKIEIK